MDVLDDRVPVVLRLSGDLLPASDAHIRDQPTLEVSLEELPNALFPQRTLNWRDPDGGVEFLLREIVHFLELVNVDFPVGLSHSLGQVKGEVLADVVLNRINMGDLGLALEDCVVKQVLDSVVIDKVEPESELF